MKYLVLAVVALSLGVAGSGCDEAKPDSPAEAAARSQCKALFAHLVAISPHLDGKDPAKVAAALPVEDYESCMTTEVEIRDCMMGAKDVAGVKACIPKDDILKCMRRAKDVPEIRKRCWAGDAHAADQLKATE
ncbi:MAG: hypothetical protein ABI467_07155 [Kofleriaceae bacterium]